MMNSYALQCEQLQRIFLVITDACNARCPLCHYWQTVPGEQNYLSLSLVESKIVPLIKRYEIPAVCITGGEPTLHPELPQILEVLKQTGAIITLITNGSHLDRLFDQIKYNVHAWLFSLDADNEILHRQIRGLANFVELIGWPQKIKTAYPAAQIAFNCLIQKQNIRNLVHLYELIGPLPCEGIFFNVPDLNLHSFGRKGRDISLANIKKYIVPDDEEIEILKKNLAVILDLERRQYRGKIMQGDAFFKGCIQYFEFLRGKEAAFKDNNNPCGVPLTSIVVNETGDILPCFYLPPDFRAQQLDRQEELKAIYCRRCFQFQG